ncbi:MAG: alkaline phosphatase family protein [Terriglobales bacterium]
MDALGWPVAEAHSFLRSRLLWRRPLRTTLGYSSGAIPTLLSGVRPDEHGHWNLLYYDPAGSPFDWLRRLPLPAVRCLDNRWGRRGLTWLGRHLLGLGPGFECALRPELLPWFNWGERRYLFQPGSLSPCTSAFDWWERARLRYRIYSYRDGSDQQLLARALRDVRRGTVDTVFLYLCELDHHLHLHRSEPALTGAVLARYATALEKLYAAAESRDPRMCFRVFSDHGMAPVRERADLAGRLRARGWQPGRDYLAVFDSTMLRFWFRREPARTDITAWLAALDCGRILTEAELRQEGVWFGDARFGEVIFLLHPGVMVAAGEFNGGGWNPCGMHGYDPGDADSDAVLLSNCAGDIRLHSIRDLFGCLCEPLALRRTA